MKYELAFNYNPSKHEIKAYKVVEGSTLIQFIEGIYELNQDENRIWQPLTKAEYVLDRYVQVFVTITLIKSR